MCFQILIEITLFIVTLTVLYLVGFNGWAITPQNNDDDDAMPIERSTAQEDLASNILYEPPPSTIYADERLLPHNINYGLRPLSNSEHTEYVINGEAFRLDERPTEERYRKVEIYMNVDKMEEFSDYSSLLDGDDSTLRISVLNFPSGVIINSNAYLSHQKWNTLIDVLDGTVWCAVCSKECDQTHIQTNTHKVNLEKHQPLERFDLSIVRKIEDFYHCGVCNILFHPVDTEAHFASTDHGNNMLSSTNKASDMMYDEAEHSNEPKKDTYHYNAKAINGDYIESDDEIEYENDEYESEDIDIDDEDDENFYANVPPLKNFEHSYASMARKPKNNLPKVLKVDLGDKTVTVNFDSWHMVIRPERNRFYCMVCTHLGHLKEKADHCKNEVHLDKLAQCKVVDSYENYLVRQVDDKYYHCGNCNNLQVIDEMDHHISSKHPQQTLDSPSKIRPSSAIERNLPSTSGINDVTGNNGVVKNENNEKGRKGNDKSKNENDNATGKNGNDAIALRNDNKLIMGLGDPDFMSHIKMLNSNVMNDVVICTFNHNVRISKLAFNVVCANGEVFYCGLCEINLNKDDVKAHVNQIRHYIMLQYTPFLETFNIHLFRKIRGALHCAACNELIQLNDDSIINHKKLPKHIFSISRATNNNAVPQPNNNIVELPQTKNSNVPQPVKEIKNVPVPVKKSATTKIQNHSQNNVNSQLKFAKNDDATPIKNQFDLLPDQNEEKSGVKHNKNTAKTNNDTPIEANAKQNDTVDTDIHNKENILPPNAQNFNHNIETTEFVKVKRGIKDTVKEDLDESGESLSDGAEFDAEEHIFVKLGNSYIKITYSSYNTLVDVGDGTKYCFICSDFVKELKKHVESRSHLENMQQNLFVDKYKEDLLRQLYLTYHCGICNVLVTSKNLTQHLSWPTHSLQAQNTKISNKQRKNEIKSNKTRCVMVNTQKENIFSNVTETKIKILLKVAFKRNNDSSVARRNKIVIFDNYVLKVSFNSWHSLSEVGKMAKCKVCQCEFESVEVASHVSSNWHVEKLENVEKQYFPALLRLINDTLANCIMCNIEVANNSNIIKEHIQGKKHKKNYESIVEASKAATDYKDCDKEPVTF